MAFQAAGILATILGVFLVKVLKDIRPQSAINGGMFASGALVTVAAFFLSQGMFGDLSIFYAALLGIAAALLLGLITQYYTSSDNDRK